VVNECVRYSGFNKWSVKHCCAWPDMVVNYTERSLGKMKNAMKLWGCEGWR